MRGVDFVAGRYLWIMTKSSMVRAGAAVLVVLAAACGRPRETARAASDTPSPPPAREASVAGGVQLPESVQVFKDASCGCCKAWVQYMRDSGFVVTATDVASPDALDSVKVAHHVPGAAASCHTALVGGYVVEGHVPADLVRRMLRERPDIVGLAVPGMVTGSPGMEGPNPEHYTVVAMLRDGTTRPYAER